MRRVTRSKRPNNHLPHHVDEHPQFQLSLRVCWKIEIEAGVDGLPFELIKRRKHPNGGVFHGELVTILIASWPDDLKPPHATGRFAEGRYHAHECLICCLVGHTQGRMSAARQQS